MGGSQAVLENSHLISTYRSVGNLDHTTRMSKAIIEKKMADTPVSEPDGRVAQILDEAARLFRDKGFAATSMNDVARVVGVSKPALYHHFASKEDLFVAVVVREPQAAADRMMAVACEPDLSAAEKLRHLLDLAYENMLESTAGRMMHTIAETSARFPEIARNFRDGFIAGQQSALAKIVADGIARGEFKSADADFMMELTFGPPMMLSLTNSMYGDLSDSHPLDLEAAKRKHFDALMRLLRAR
jgi:AcrR family transcriptional regulator